MSVNDIVSGFWPTFWVAVSIGLVLTVIATVLLASVTGPHPTWFRGTREFGSEQEQLPPVSSGAEHEHVLV